MGVLGLWADPILFSSRTLLVFRCSKTSPPHDLYWESVAVAPDRISEDTAHRQQDMGVPMAPLPGARSPCEVALPYLPKKILRKASRLHVVPRAISSATT